MALTVEDRLEILQLLARYAHATDGVDAEARADVFTDDGCSTHPGRRCEGARSSSRRGDRRTRATCATG